MKQKSVFSSLHASTNAHPFIFRLPTEILEDIFIQCASDYHCEHDGRPRSAAPSWVNVSYVCHRWRNVALNCATIWTYVFITSQRWTEELLARSRQASLKIRIWLLDESRWLNTVEKVMDHLERIQELRLDVPAPYNQQVLSKLSSRAPRLQNLEITLEDPSPEWPSLPFDGVPPALHTLELTDCSVPLSSFKLNALTTLGLHYVPDQFKQNIEEFLAVMGYMKDLKHLYLDQALASATGFLSSAVFRTFEKIDLPHLARLLIGAPLSTSLALLSCVNIPLETSVKLECDSEPDFPFDNHALLCSLLTRKCSMAKGHALSSSTILTLVINIFSAPTLTFSAYERDFTVVSDWDSNVPLQIDLNLSEDDLDEDRITSNIFCSMSFSNVGSLFIIRPPFSPAFWRRMLGYFQDVRCIRLYAGNMPDLSVLSLTGLTTDEGVQNQDGLATGDRGQSHILAPRLEELVLDRIIFLPERDYDLPELAITRRSLLDSLSTRRGMHGRLTMTQCAIGNSDRFDSVMVWGDGKIHVICDSENNEE
ncbi:hypothetical protein L210DRAFT_2664781 [Boletus edulis BED1]|uniref:F-box domain-containing protein n=1 Tax=Boletus edulis BED1 TaxID=1328754 RepID=A0AAD4C6J2_BOLED|nr:hypothetical protein L210DRAFT_2664781 [Boletus edulis BED1]